MNTVKCCVTMGLLTFLQTLFSCSDRKPGMISAAGYYFDEHKWHYYGGFGNASYLEIPDADTATFEKLDGIFPESTYARDKNQAYYNGKVIPGTIGKSFSRIKGYLSRDEAHIYYMSSILSDDPLHFEIIDDNVTKDSHLVFRGDRVISDDPQHFQSIGRSAGFFYYVDNKAVIVNSSHIAGADPATFQVLSHGYSSDKSHVFQIRGTLVTRVANADPATFHVLNAYYAFDTRHVFWDGNILKDADPASFRILNADVHCSADQMRAYHRNHLISNVNPASFPKEKPCRYCTPEKVVFED